MSFSKMKQSGVTPKGVDEYCVTELSDIEKIPPETMGTIALVISTSDVYIYNGKGLWNCLSDTTQPAIKCIKYFEDLQN